MSAAQSTSDASSDETLLARYRACLLYTSDAADE